MKKIIGIIIVLIGFSFENMINAPIPPNLKNVHIRELIYSGVWGTIYHAEVRQCDDTPTITGSGYEIDPAKASDLRIVAISQEMLYDMNRRNMIDTINDDRFKGKLAYGDTVWIESPKDNTGNYIYPKINGFWIIHDTKNKRYEMSIDFLQTKGDWSLFNDDPMWNGRFDNLKIFKQYATT